MLEAVYILHINLCILSKKVIHKKGGLGLVAGVPLKNTD